MRLQRITKLKYSLKHVLKLKSRVHMRTVFNKSVLTMLDVSNIFLLLYRTIDTKVLRSKMKDLEKWVTLRVTEDDKDLLASVCSARGEFPSTFIRRALRMELARLSYLSDADAKALGVRKEPNINAASEAGGG